MILKFIIVLLHPKSQPPLTTTRDLKSFAQLTILSAETTHSQRRNNTFLTQEQRILTINKD